MRHDPNGYILGGLALVLIGAAYLGGQATRQRRKRLVATMGQEMP